MAALQDYAWIGFERLVIEDKKTADVLCELEYIVNFNLSDNQPIEYLRGGIKRAKLLPFKGDREISITVSTATNKPELQQIMMDAEAEEIETNALVVEDLVCEDGTGVFNLTKVPAEGLTVNVWSKDAIGVKTKMSNGDSAASGVFVVAGQTITCDPSVTAIHVVYRSPEKRYAIKAKDGNVKAFKVTAVLWAQEVGTSNIYVADVEVPSAAIQLNNAIDASNEGGVPDNIEFTIDAMEDAVADYHYMVTYGEQI